MIGTHGSVCRESGRIRVSNKAYTDNRYFHRKELHTSSVVVVPFVHSLLEQQPIVVAKARAKFETDIY